jgi:hypothetical protein
MRSRKSKENKTLHIKPTIERQYKTMANLLYPFGNFELFCILVVQCLVLCCIVVDHFCLLRFKIVVRNITFSEKKKKLNKISHLVFMDILYHYRRKKLSTEEYALTKTNCILRSVYKKYSTLLIWYSSILLLHVIFLTTILKRKRQKWSTTIQHNTKHWTTNIQIYIKKGINESWTLFKVNLTHCKRDDLSFRREVSFGSFCAFLSSCFCRQWPVISRYWKGFVWLYFSDVTHASKSQL